MPILPPDAMAPPPQTNILYMSPRQVAEADYATQMRYAAAQRQAAMQAEQEAVDRVRDQQFHDALLQNARTDGAGKAFNTALRFQGMRGFERDRSAGRAAGLSDEQATLQALQKNAGRMFLEDPGHIAPSIRMLQPPVTVPARGGVPAHVFSQGRPYFPPAGSMEQPFEAREVRLPSGQMIVQTGPKTHQFPPRTGPTVANKLAAIRLQMDSIRDQIDVTLDPKQRAALGEDLAALRKQVKEMDLSKDSAQPQVDGSFPDDEAPSAPAVPSPAAGAPFPSKATLDELGMTEAEFTQMRANRQSKLEATARAFRPSASEPAPAASAPTGWVIVRRKSDKKEFRLPRSEWEASGGDKRYELVNRR